ncbi:MAG: hypothetical protein E7032_04340 [Akkermansiaceae bacterium]|nr:hypothetical protein [Akkermansiaceae bacterium]
MPQPYSSYDKLRELEQRRNMRLTGNAPLSRDYQRRYPANTLGPNEEIVERRRVMHRKHVTITGAAPQHRNILLGNLCILAFIAASIWGLYSLTVYLLTHY